MFMDVMSRPFTAATPVPFRLGTPDISRCCDKHWHCGPTRQQEDTMAHAPSVPPKWDIEADVVVVGFGAAGVAASVTAHDLGAKVVILEKAPEGQEGGNTRVAGQGYLNTSSVEKAAAYLTALCGPYAVPEPMVQVWAAEMCRNNAWLESLGGDPQEQQHPPVGIEFPDLPGSDCVHKFHDGPTYGYSYTWKLFERLVKQRPIPILDRKSVV